MWLRLSHQNSFGTSLAGTLLAGLPLADTEKSQSCRPTAANRWLDYRSGVSFSPSTLAGVPGLEQAEATSVSSRSKASHTRQITATTKMEAVRASPTLFITWKIVPVFAQFPLRNMYTVWNIDRQANEVTSRAQQ